MILRLESCADEKPAQCEPKSTHSHVCGILSREAVPGSQVLGTTQQALAKQFNSI